VPLRELPLAVSLLSASTRHPPPCRPPAEAGAFKDLDPIAMVQVLPQPTRCTQ